MHPITYYYSGAGDLARKYGDFLEKISYEGLVHFCAVTAICLQARIDERAYELRHAAREHPYLATSDADVLIVEFNNAPDIALHALLVGLASILESRVRLHE